MSQSPSHPAQPPLHPWETTPQEVARLRADKADFVFIDCRRPDEYEIARIDASTQIPLQELADRKSDLESQKDKLIIVYCHTGRRSMTFTTVLRADGFTNVKSMAGGIDRWSLEIDQSVPRY